MFAPRPSPLHPTANKTDVAQGAHEAQGARGVMGPIRRKGPKPTDGAAGGRLGSGRRRTDGGRNTGTYIGGTVATPVRAASYPEAWQKPLFALLPALANIDLLAIGEIRLLRGYSMEYIRNLIKSITSEHFPDFISCGCGTL